MDRLAWLAIQRGAFDCECEMVTAEGLNLYALMDK